jgi:hypothetical protein
MRRSLTSYIACSSSPPPMLWLLPTRRPGINHCSSSGSNNPGKIPTFRSLLALRSSNHRGNLHGTAALSFSSASSSSWYNPAEWWKNRQLSKEADKFKERVQAMAAKEAYKLTDMLEELDEVNKSWMAKVPGLNNKDTEMAKVMYKTVAAMVSVLGQEATYETLLNTSKKERLEIAIAADTTLDDVQLITEQIRMMSITQRVMRKRALDGKPLPTTMGAMQVVLENEVVGVLTRQEKIHLAEKQTKEALRKRK